MNQAGAYSSVAAQPRDSDALVARHAGLVKRIAWHLAGRLPPSVDVDDLVQAGMIGLLEAAAHYSPGRGASFETYAGIRIRGAMIDALRKLDWAPRSVHRRAREVAGAMRAVEEREGREAQDAEVAAELGLTLEEYHRIVQDAAFCQVASLDESDGAAEVADQGQDPGLAVEQGELRTAMAEAIAGLPERERLVMSLYYDEELNLKEIGAVLGVSESRVCQIHGQALSRLRSRLRQWRME
jgi:RNA polymerase sigma factor for flagellar operon FliA